MDDYYATLQVMDTTSPAVIRAAYRALSQRYHPDKNPDDPDAEAVLKRLNEAYAILSDPAKRRAYDAHRRAAAASTAASAQAGSPTATESAAHATSPAPPTADAFTGTVNGHTFTLRCYPAQMIANTVWTETATTAGRDYVTVHSTPRQQLGFRPDTGQDFFIEAAGHPIPVALDQAVVLFTAQGGRLQRAEWVALWNRSTGDWYWLGHTQQSIGKAIRTDAAAARDFLGYVLRVAVSVFLIGYLIQGSTHWLGWLPVGVLGSAFLLGWQAPRRTQTAEAIGWTLRQKIATLVDHLEGGRYD